MSGIYIHIPFCKQACTYCDFHFSTSTNALDNLLASIKKEVELQKGYLNGNSISTVYFGGGTPSLLSETQLMYLFEALEKHFAIEKNAEITLEANPDDLTKEKIKQLKATPINRLSIGVQSFYDDDLKLMNRAHTSHEAEHSVKAAQDAGFENITIDLIYGTQSLDNHKWKHNLHTGFGLDVKHISAYCLTVEPKTALAYLIKTKQLENIDEQRGAEQFEIMLEEMDKHNFIQYEISNFCKAGFESKHNSNYWLKQHYLGLGPSAHSYNGTSRQWNIANNALYIDALEKDKLNFEIEELTAEERFNEYMMTALRTMWGVDLKYIKSTFGKDYWANTLNEAEKYINSGKILFKEDKLFLSPQGKLFADRIASDFFIIHKTKASLK